MLRNSSRKSDIQISVVVPTLNEEKYLKTCLENLESDLKGKKHEIIIVDGNSTDRTLEIAALYTKKIIRGKNPIGAARQAGLKAARSNIVAFIDADSFPLKGWSRAAIDAISKPGIVMAFGPAKAVEDIPLKSGFEFLYNFIISSMHRMGFSHVSGFNMVLNKKLALKAGGFNPNLHVFEDIDLALRIIDYGKILYSDNLVVKSSVRRLKSFSGVIPYFKSWFSYLRNGSTEDVEFIPIR